MVSPAPTASDNPPPLSYADRAKKAQNIRQKSQLASQRSPSQGTSAAPLTISASTVPGTSSVPSGSLAASTVSKPSSPTANTDVASTFPLPSASTPSSPHPLVDTNGSKVNGDVNHSDSVSSVPLATKPSPASPMNVWNIRKEQMAQARARQAPPSSLPSSQKPLQSQSTAFSPPSSSHPPDVAEAVSAHTSSINQNITNHRLVSGMDSTAAVNGRKSVSNDTEDAFVVRPNLVQPQPIPSHTLPSIDDVESWPEVGQASSTHSRESNGPVGTNEKDEGEREHERERSHSQGTSRKSEKTKWIPIPPEELRAAHDAQRPNRTQHTRNRSAHHSRTQGGAGGSGSPSASGSVSGQTSQGQSRTHSSVGMRPAPSHTSSVSHSQAQSRTGSVHSSPRQLSMRGGRRLPEEGIVTGSSGYSSTAFNASTLGPGRSMKSSGTSSPQVLGQPLPIPSLEFTPSIGYQAPNMAPGSRASSNPVQITPEVSNGTTYYPTHIPPNLAVPAYHSPRPAGSPVANPYALPMMGPVYPQASVAPALPVQPGYATPPSYVGYPSYGYPYGGGPYMFWAPPGTAPGSAVGPPAEGGVPPATMIVRPPPPNESDAVAGYRDVGFALPSPVTYGRRDEGEVAAAGETVERGRRARELSFGSIGIPGASKSPSPAPIPPNLQTRMAEGGGSLGLDVGVSIARTETAVVEEGTEESMEKAFEKFTVGVGPGEPVPARIKSKTRTQSKGRKLDESSIPSEHSEPFAEAVNAEDNGDASEGAEAGAKVIDLTDPETKWEFGTTHHGEQAAKVEKASASPSLSVPIAVGAVPNKNAVPYVPAVVIPPTVPNNLPTPFSPSDVPSSALSTSDAVTTDEWEVKDYGWGFGRGGPPTSSYQPPILRDDRGVRDRERREFQDKQSDREYHGRPRRGSYGSYGYDRGGPERGGYSGRRGRGGFGGRGYHNRSYSRGGYQGQQQQRPPFTVTQPPLPPPSDINGYYAPPPQLATYIPSGYDGYPYAPYAPAPVPVPTPQTAQSPSQSQQVPPMPMPQSVLSFPLDPTRYYLLGQLEYYLSPQNIVQDFFLRQRMDSRGWISIPLIASFNRVKQLTVDLQLVRDVLSLSSLVEVRGDWVRMREWEHFVLPNAVRSSVEESHSLAEGSYASPGAGGEGGHTEDSGEAEALGHDDDEEEEEEDVVFVLG